MTPAFAYDLPHLPGQKVTGVLVEYAPGASSPPHHHTSRRVGRRLCARRRDPLEGERRPEKVYRAGESWLEPPDAAHAVSAERQRHGARAPARGLRRRATAPSSPPVSTSSRANGQEVRAAGAPRAAERRCGAAPGAARLSPAPWRRSRLRPRALRGLRGRHAAGLRRPDRRAACPRPPSASARRPVAPRPGTRGSASDSSRVRLLSGHPCTLPRASMLVAIRSKTSLMPAAAVGAVRIGSIQVSATSCATRSRMTARPSAFLVGK